MIQKECAGSEKTRKAIVATRAFAMLKKDTISSFDSDQKGKQRRKTHKRDPKRRQVLLRLRQDARDLRVSLRSDSCVCLLPRRPAHNVFVPPLRTARVPPACAHSKNWRSDRQGPATGMAETYEHNCLDISRCRLRNDALAQAH